MGGQAYLICSRLSLPLAERPQNLPAVRALTNANSYFLDTTFAAPLRECFDPHHPLRRQDDMYWKQALADYARKMFTILGSEDGDEWAIPHSDYFEGMVGVRGRYFEDARFPQEFGGTEIGLRGRCRSRAGGGELEFAGLSLRLQGRRDGGTPTLWLLVESPSFVVFHARNWKGLSYADPPLFTLHSLDGKPLNRSSKIRLYHGFGDTRIKVAT